MKHLATNTIDPSHIWFQILRQIRSAMALPANIRQVPSLNIIVLKDIGLFLQVSSYKVELR